MMYERFIMRQKYDLLLPIGNYCLASDMLRMNNLQCESYPMDWLCFENFNDVLNMLEQNYAGLLDTAHLTRIAAYKRNDVYLNDLYHVELRHDFFHDADFDENLETARAKYQRRIERVNKRIAEAQNILLIHVEKNADDDTAKLLQQFARLQNIFRDKQIEMVFVSLREDIEQTSSEDITPQIRRINLKIYDREDYNANKLIAKPLLKGFSTKWRVRFKQQIHRFIVPLRRPFLKLLVGLLPMFPETRARLKEIYKDRFRT